ncbi:hypothetical protein PG994_014439 [Apiospora phragmitis]|uniref:Uncharacterized protein n=1 Tax=Apiospora phragmitis TaxID=2905665 RepID=A0ABR1T4C2_9PEZI
MTASSTLAVPRAMTPQRLPKLVIYQPDWFEELNLQEHKAHMGFWREMALKKLLSTYDDDEIEEYLELEDDDPLIGEILQMWV